MSPRPPRPKVTDEIIETLRRDIASGALARGARLPNERELAQHFGVSQPTIREAIRALDAMGLVEVRHGSGAYVAADVQQFVASALHLLLQIERVGILDVLELRRVLGLFSAARAARDATDLDVEAIDASATVLEDVDSEDDVQRIAEAAVTFQIALSAAANNPLLFALEGFLVRLIMQLQLSVLARRGVRFWRPWTANFAGDRRRLVDAVRARDEDATVEAMSAYLQNQYDLFAGDRELVGIRFSDPRHARTFSDVVLRVPDLRPAHEGQVSAHEGSTPA